ERRVGRGRRQLAQRRDRRGDPRLAAAPGVERLEEVPQDGAGAAQELGVLLAGVLRGEEALEPGARGADVAAQREEGPAGGGRRRMVREIRGEVVGDRTAGAQQRAIETVELGAQRRERVLDVAALADRRQRGDLGQRGLVLLGVELREEATGAA